MNTTQIMAILKKSPVFGSLEESLLDTLIFLAYPEMFAAGDVIYTRGEPSDGRFGMILSGRVQVLKKSGDVVCEISVGEVIGEIALSETHHKRTMTVKAAEPTEVLVWNVEHIKEQIPGVWKKLLKLAWTHLSDYSEYIDE